MFSGTIDLRLRALSDATFHFSFCCHAELVSASHREPFLVFLRGQILKRVQDDGVWVVVGFGGLKPSDALPFRIFMTQFPLLPFWFPLH